MVFTNPLSLFPAKSITAWVLLSVCMFCALYSTDSAALVSAVNATTTTAMRVCYRRQHPGADGDVPDFLKDEISPRTCVRTGFDVDFPALARNPFVAAALGFTGSNFISNSVDIIRWYNRATKVITGSVVFSGDCEGPPGIAHGGAVAAALDDILGTMVWREAGFSRRGIPTVELTVRYKNPTPMRRPLRFDTRLVKREGRKVTATVTLRDPAAPDTILAEGDGLFYIRKPPECVPIAEELESTPCDDYAAVGPGGEKINAETTLRFRNCMSYDEAIRRFGRGNPDAEANLVAFYGGNVAAVRANL